MSSCLLLLVLIYFKSPSAGGQVVQYSWTYSVVCVAPIWRFFKKTLNLVYSYFRTLLVSHSWIKSILLNVWVQTSSAKYSLLLKCCLINTLLPFFSICLPVFDRCSHYCFHFSKELNNFLLMFKYRTFIENIFVLPSGRCKSSVWELQKEIRPALFLLK